MEVIYCVGDSHANLFSEHPRFKVYACGGATAYGLTNLSSRSEGRKKLLEWLAEIPKGSKVMFCYGEIDCRVHLIKQAEKQGRGIIDIVRECVKKYLSVVLETRERGYEVLVWGVPPSMRRTLRRHEIKKYGNYPITGTCQERNEATFLFNYYLEKLAAKHGIKIISIFNKLIDTDWQTKTGYFSDPVHLSKEVIPMVLEEIRKCQV